MAAQMPERGPAVQPERRTQDHLLSKACSMPSWMPHPRVFSSTQSIRSGPTTEASCGVPDVGSRSASPGCLATLIPSR